MLDEEELRLVKIRVVAEESVQVAVVVTPVPVSCAHAELVQSWLSPAGNIIMILPLLKI